jgi:hypothetical protein
MSGRREELQVANKVRIRPLHPPLFTRVSPGANFGTVQLLAESLALYVKISQVARLPRVGASGWNSTVVVKIS